MTAIKDRVGRGNAGGFAIAGLHNVDENRDCSACVSPRDL